MDCETGEWGGRCSSVEERDATVLTVLTLLLPSRSTMESYRGGTRCPKCHEHGAHDRPPCTSGGLVVPRPSGRSLPLCSVGMMDGLLLPGQDIDTDATLLLLLLQQDPLR